MTLRDLIQERDDLTRLLELFFTTIDKVKYDEMSTVEKSYFDKIHGAIQTNNQKLKTFIQGL